MEALPAGHAAAAFVLLLGAFGLCGWLAGSSAHHYGGLARRIARMRPARRFCVWLNFSAVALLLGYYSHVFLPVLLVAAYSGWLYQDSMRLRREKKALLLDALIGMRKQPAAGARGAKTGAST